MESASLVSQRQQQCLEDVEQSACRPTACDVCVVDAFRIVTRTNECFLELTSSVSSVHALHVFANWRRNVGARKTGGSGFHRQQENERYTHDAKRTSDVKSPTESGIKVASDTHAQLNDSRKLS